MYRALTRAMELRAWLLISAVWTCDTIEPDKKPSSACKAATPMSMPFMRKDLLGSSAVRFGGRPWIFAHLAIIIDISLRVAWPSNEEILPYIVKERRRSHE